MAANRIYIQVDFQSESASQNVTKLNQQIKNIGPTTQQASKQATQGLKGFSVAVNESTHGLDQLGQAIAGLGIFKMIGEMVKAGDEVTKTKIAFESLGASAEESAKTIEKLRAVAERSPLSFDEIREAAQRLRAFGFELKEIPDMVETISNAMAALGKGKQGIDSVTLALGQMKAKGIIQGQEAFRQLAEQSINAAKYLRPAIEQEVGRAVSELDVRTYIEKGMVTANRGVQIIMEGIKNEFGKTGERTVQLATAQVTKLIDDLKRLGGDVAGAVGPEIKQVIAWAREAVKWFGELPPAVKETTLAFLALAGILSTLGAAAKFGLFSWVGTVIPLLVKLTGVVRTLGLALQLAFEARSITGFFALFSTEIGAATAAMTAALPVIALLALAITGLGAAWEESAKRAKAAQQAPGWKPQRPGDRPTAAQLASHGRVGQGIDQFGREGFMKDLPDADPAGKAARDKLLRESGEAAKHQMEIAQQALERAQRRAAASANNFVDEMNDKYAGLLREVAGNVAATETVARAKRIEILVEVDKAIKENTKDLGKYVEELKKEGEETNKAYAERYKDHLQYQVETDEMALDAFRLRREYEQTALAADRDEQIAALDVVHREGAKAEIQYQEQKLAIQTSYAERIRDAAIELENDDFRRRLLQEQALLDAKVISTADYMGRVEALTLLSNEKIRQLIMNSDIEIAKARLDANKATNDAIYEEQKKLYENIKSGLGKIWDAFFNHTKSIWSAIGSAIKTAILNAMKDVVTSAIAARFMALVTGQQQGVQQRQLYTPEKQGGLTKLMLGGFGGGMMTGGLSGISLPLPAVTLPGGGGGGAGEVWSERPPTGSVGARTGGLFSGLTGNLGSLKGMLMGTDADGWINLGRGNAVQWGGSATLGQKMGAAASSQLAGMLGAGLLYAGLKRGGASGLAMSGIGGAFVGASIGNMVGGLPGAAIGAAIGAGAGLIAGTVRLFVKTADEKIRAKVKQVYGIDIKEKNIRAQILEIAKQKYGGNLDLAVRSPEVRELITLYGVTQGLSPANMPRPMYNATFAQSSSGLALQPTYSNGQMVANPYTGTTTAQWANAGLYATAPGGNMYVQLNPQQANDLFEGRVVSVIQNNGGTVAQSAAQGLQSGTARSSQRNALLEPLSVMQ